MIEDLVMRYRRIDLPTVGLISLSFQTTYDVHAVGSFYLICDLKAISQPFHYFDA